MTKTRIVLALAIVFFVQAEVHTQQSQKPKVPAAPGPLRFPTETPLAIEITSPQQNDSIQRYGTIQIRAKVLNLPANHTVYWRAGDRSEVLGDVAEGNARGWHEMQPIGGQMFEADVPVAKWTGDTQFVVFYRPPGPMNKDPTGIVFSMVRRFEIITGH